jgi:hypothetical protein
MGFNRVRDTLKALALGVAMGSGAAVLASFKKTKTEKWSRWIEAEMRMIAAIRPPR